MFIDPSIAVASLGLTPQMLYQDFETFGFLFENVCYRDLKIYSSALGGTLSYYRDRMNLKVDGVLHLHDGRYALIEFKLSSKQIEQAATHLRQVSALIQQANKVNPHGKIPEPTLLMIITGGDMAYTRKDGIKIIPIGCLRD